jgi:hypothetical protein
MSKTITSFVGLDVHQDATANGNLRGGRVAPSLQPMDERPNRVSTILRKYLATRDPTLPPTSTDLFY